MFSPFHFKPSPWVNKSTPFLPTKPRQQNRAPRTPTPQIHKVHSHINHRQTRTRHNCSNLTTHSKSYPFRHQIITQKERTRIRHPLLKYEQIFLKRFRMHHRTYRNQILHQYQQKHNSFRQNHPFPRIHRGSRCCHRTKRLNPLRQRS